MQADVAFFISIAVMAMMTVGTSVMKGGVCYAVDAFFPPFLKERIHISLSTVF